MAIIELEHVEGDYRVVLGSPTNELVLIGQHGDTSVRALRRRLADLIALDGQDLVVDLAATTAITGTVVDELVGAATYLADRQRRLFLRSPSPAVRHALATGGALDLVRPQLLPPPARPSRHRRFAFSLGLGRARR